VTFDFDLLTNREGSDNEVRDAEGTVQSREIRAKKTPDRRGPEQSKVK
jgi:hypothetical protein